MVLGGGGYLIDFGNGANEGIRRHGSETVMEGCKVIIGVDGTRLGFQHGALVELCFHFDSGDASGRVARCNGALNGRSPPPARQDGGMTIDGHDSGDV